MPPSWRCRRSWRGASAAEEFRQTPTNDHGSATYPPHMTEIGHHDDVYRSTPLEQKLAWFQNAPGLSAVEPAREFMAGAAALYTDSDSAVRATLRNLGADWTGDAATNAGATLQRAAHWSHDAGASHGIAGGRPSSGYGESFEFVRGHVHWDDPWAWGWNDTASAAASVATLNPVPFLGNLTADYYTTAQAEPHQRRGRHRRAAGPREAGPHRGHHVPEHPAPACPTAGGPRPPPRCAGARRQPPHPAGGACGHG